jgi:hypothetical protein
VLKLSRIVRIVLAGVLIFPATASAEPGCRKHRDPHSHKWTTRCGRVAPPAMAPAEPVVVVPPSGPNTDPTDRYWYDPED